MTDSEKIEQAADNTAGTIKRDKPKKVWLLLSNVTDKGKFKVSLELDGKEEILFNNYVEQNEVVVCESHNLTWMLSEAPKPLPEDLAKVREKLALEIMSELDIDPAAWRTFKAMGMIFDACHALLSQELERERARTTKLVEALEFYANKNHWSNFGRSNDSTLMKNDFDSVRRITADDELKVAGAKARQALLDLRGEATGEGEK